MCIRDSKKTHAACHHFEGGREAVRLQTVLIALRTMEEALASF